NKFDARFDFFLSPRQTAFFRTSWHHGNIVDAEPITGPAGGNGNGTIHDYNKQISAGYTFLFSQNSILDARVGFTWTLGGKTPYGLGQPSLMVQAGVPGLPTDPIVSRSLSAESVSNFSQFGAQTSNPQFQNPFAIDPKVNYTMLKGRNSVKVGYEYQAINTEIDDFNPVYGQDTFGGYFSSGPLITSGSYSSNGNVGFKEAATLADFLVGARSAYQLSNFRIVNYHQRMNFFYGQDDLKLRRNLTINAGLRYELVTPQYVDGDHLANFNPSTNTLVQSTGGSVTQRALVGMPKLNFAPRIGFSYGLNDKTVFRGGYGISFDQFNREGGENLLAYNGPYIVNSSITQNISNPICAVNAQSNSCFSPTMQGYGTTFVSSANFSTALAQTRYIPSNISTGYVQAWHFGLQRTLAGGTLLDVSYVGEHGVKIWVLDDINQAAPNVPSATCSNTVTTG